MQIYLQILREPNTISANERNFLGMPDSISANGRNLI